MDNQIICPECRSTDVGQLVINNEHRHECQNCYRTWSSDKFSPRHPGIEVQLVGNDGNAFFIIGTVSRALRKARLSEHEVKDFNDEAMSSDYDNLLKVCMEWVTVL